MHAGINISPQGKVNSKNWPLKVNLYQINNFMNLVLWLLFYSFISFYQSFIVKPEPVEDLIHGDCPGPHWVKYFGHCYLFLPNEYMSFTQAEQVGGNYDALKVTMNQ